MTQKHNATDFPNALNFQNTLKNMGQNIPVIFVNYGNPFYLKYSISQAISLFPKNSVILLGDKTNFGYKGLRHEMIEDYWSTAKEFSKYYEHFNTNPYPFELFCFQRWFVLNDYLKKNNIDRAIYIDSDAILYKNLSDELTFFDDVEMTLNINDEHIAAGINCNIFTQKGIEEFCAFCINAYKEKNEYYQKCVTHFQALQSNNKPGGVCDMTLLYFYYLLHPDKIYNFNQPPVDKPYFDLDINASRDPYVRHDASGGKKQFKWIKKVPYAQTYDNKWVELPIIHFSGKTKALIPEYVNYKGCIFFYNTFFIKLKNQLTQMFHLFNWHKKKS